MVKIMVEEVTFKLCEKCGVYRNPSHFKVKKQKRKSCKICRGRK
jgi:hypothetical protein